MSTTTLPPTKKTEPVSAPKGGITDRARGERKLGWMLAGPAFVVMLAVTASITMKAGPASSQPSLRSPRARSVIPPFGAETGSVFLVGGRVVVLTAAAPHSGRR